jgi:hypothetical protein
MDPVRPALPPIPVSIEHRDNTRNPRVESGTFAY